MGLHWQKHLNIPDAISVPFYLVEVHYLKSCTKKSGAVLSTPSLSSPYPTCRILSTSRRYQLRLSVFWT